MAEVTGWRPIESAPRDGRPILVWFRGRFFVAEFSGVWTPENKRWVVRQPPTGLDAGEWLPVHDISAPTFPDGVRIHGTHEGPTHWMPLPPPPEE